MKNFLTVYIVAFFCFGSLSAETITKSFDAKGIESLELKNTTGKISVKGTEKDEATVQINKIRMDKSCKITVNKKGKTLLVEIESSTWFKREKCHADLNVTIPVNASIDLKSGAGDIEINETHGSIKFLSGSGDVEINKSEIAELDGKVGSGNINVKAKINKSEIKSGSGSLKMEGEIGDVDLRSGSGSIRLIGLTNSAEILTGSGNIDLTYSKITSGSSLKIKSGSGDATVFLPQDAKLYTDFWAGSGKENNEFGDEKDADFNIAFKVGSGNLNIKKSR